MNDVTLLLEQIDGGDSSAAERLLPVVYEELRRLASQMMANERPDHTLQTTALVHEAYVRLVDVTNPQSWDGRRHFFGAASEAMRRILVESARRKKQLKRGGQYQRVPLDAVDIPILQRGVDELLMLDESIDQLAAVEPRAAEIMKLRCFGGHSVKDIADMLDMGQSTVAKYWAYAKAWFQRALEQDN